MTTKNLLWLEDRLKRRLDNNPDQADSSYSSANMRSALNEAYTEEVNKAKMEGSRKWFIQKYEFTWAASTPTYSIDGTPMEYMDAFIFQDVTDNTNLPRDITLLWNDRKTLYWGSSSGPSSAKTIRVLYLANAEELTSDTSEPDLIAPAHRDLLPLAAAILLAEESDLSVPASWERRLMEKRLMWWKTLQARPRNDVAEIGNRLISNGLNQGPTGYYDSYLDGSS